MKLTPKRKKLILAVAAIAIVVTLVYLWDKGSSQKAEIMSNLADAVCGSSPITAIFESILGGRDTGVLCMNAGEQFTSEAIIYKSIPLIGGSEGYPLDYLMYENQVRNGILPISSVTFRCPSSDLCSEDTIRAYQKVKFTASTACEETPTASAEFPGYTNSQVLAQFFDKALECTMDVTVITEQEALGKAKSQCPADKTGNSASDFVNEIGCYLSDFSLSESERLRKSYEGENPLMIALGASNINAIIGDWTAAADMVFIGIVTGIAQLQVEDTQELSAFENGAIRRFSDGTSSLESHAGNLESKADGVYDALKKANALSTGSTGGVEYYKTETAFDYSDVMLRTKELVLDLLDDQGGKLDDDLTAGDFEMAALRGQFIAHFVNIGGWIVESSAFPEEPGNTEIGYKTANCLEWLAKHSEVPEADCGSVTLNSGTTFSAEDLPELEGVNGTVTFEANEEAAVFSSGGPARFDNGILRALDTARIGITAKTDESGMVVTFSSG